MRTQRLKVTILALIIIIIGCKKDENPPVVNDPTNNTTLDENAILIDASKDGGSWWSGLPHQGEALANYLRSSGFVVDELYRFDTVTDELLRKYNKVIVAAPCFWYSGEELAAYDKFLRTTGAVLLIFSEFHRNSYEDQIAKHLGFTLAGVSVNSNGGSEINMTRFADHAITQDVGNVRYKVGSALIDTNNSKVEILGWLSSDCFVDLDDDGIQDSHEPAGPSVMGILRHPTAKIFFIGDLNTMEDIPQPLTDNLIQWAFGTRQN